MFSRRKPRTKLSEIFESLSCRLWTLDLAADAAALALFSWLCKFFKNASLRILFANISLLTRSSKFLDVLTSSRRPKPKMPDRLFCTGVALDWVLGWRLPVFILERSSSIGSRLDDGEVSAIELRAGLGKKRSKSQSRNKTASSPSEVVEDDVVVAEFADEND